MSWFGTPGFTLFCRSPSVEQDGGWHSLCQGVSPTRRTWDLFHTSVSTEPFILLLPPKSTPTPLFFHSLLLSYPILSNLSSPHSVSVFISSHPLVLQGPTPFMLGPNHTLGLVITLFSLTFPARPSFPALWTRTGSYFSHHLDGSGRNKELFLYNCAITSFSLLQNLHKIQENYDFHCRGTISVRCSKRGVLKTMANVEPLLWDTAAAQILKETLTWYYRTI